MQGSAPIRGVINPGGLNPNEDACLWPEDLFGIGYDYDGTCINDIDSDAICDETDPCLGNIDCLGRTLEFACNCNAGATE